MLRFWKVWSGWGATAEAAEHPSLPSQGECPVPQQAKRTGWKETRNMGYSLRIQPPLIPMYDICTRTATSTSVTLCTDPCSWIHAAAHTIKLLALVHFKSLQHS